MKLRVYFYPGTAQDLDSDTSGFTVSCERDILKAGFAAARRVREWLRAMPFVPSQSNLRFHITADVVSDEEAAAAAPATKARNGKRKKKAGK